MSQKRVNKTKKPTKKKKITSSTIKVSKKIKTYLPPNHYPNDIVYDVRHFSYDWETIEVPEQLHIVSSTRNEMRPYQLITVFHRNYWVNESEAHRAAGDWIYNKSQQFENKDYRVLTRDTKDGTKLYFIYVTATRKK